MRNAFKIIAIHPIQIIQFINYASQRVYGIVLGYEDVNDHDKLRYDPALAIALEKLDFINVVTKVCHGSTGSKIRHVVTSLPASKIPPSLLYTDKYCPRGEMENRIKEQQLDLFADRTSTYAKRYPLGQTFDSNQLRLWLS